MLLVLVMFFWPEHCTRTFFSDVPLAIPISPLFLLVQGDIYEPSCEGHVSEAGVDGLEGRNSSIAPTRYQIKWISRKLDAISPNRCWIHSSSWGVLSIYYLFMVVVVVSLFDRQRMQTDRLCFCELWWKQSAVNSASSEIQFVHFSAIIVMRLFQYPPFLLVIKTWCLTRRSWQLDSDFRPNVFRISHWATGSWHSIFQAIASPFAVPAQDLLKFKPSFVAVQQETRTRFVRTHAAEGLNWVFRLDPDAARASSLVPGASRILRWRPPGPSYHIARFIWSCWNRYLELTVPLSLNLKA
jgi:hypothetical protein